MFDPHCTSCHVSTRYGPKSKWHKHKFKVELVELMLFALLNWTRVRSAWAVVTLKQSHFSLEGINDFKRLVLNEWNVQWIIIIRRHIYILLQRMLVNMKLYTTALMHQGFPSVASWCLDEHSGPTGRNNQSSSRSMILIENVLCTGSSHPQHLLHLMPRRDY